MKAQRSIKLVMGGGPKAAKLGQPNNTKGKNGAEDPGTASLRLGDLTEAKDASPTNSKDTTAEVATDDSTGTDATTINTETPRDRLSRAFQEMNDKLQAFNAQVQQGQLTAQQARAANEAAKALQQQNGYSPKPPSAGGGGASKGGGSSPKKSSGSGSSDTAKLKKALSDAKKENEKNAAELAKLKKEKSGGNKDKETRETPETPETREGEENSNKRNPGRITTISNEEYEKLANDLEKNGFKVSDEDYETLKKLSSENKTGHADERFEILADKVDARRQLDGSKPGVEPENLDSIDNALEDAHEYDSNAFDLDEIEEEEEVEEPEPEPELDESDEE